MSIIGPQALRLFLWCSVAAVLLCCASLGAVARTADGDKQALLAFKSGLTDDGGLLSGWDEATDPCIDLWTGVKCDCNDFFYSVGNTLACSPPPPQRDNSSRVLQINFGDPRITNWNRLKGTIHPSLGALSELRVLNLNEQHLYGPLPDSLEGLAHLEHLLVAKNRLTGALPPYLGSLGELRYVWLNDNFFAGKLPSSWCSGAWWQFRVDGNVGVCDEVPPCLRDRILSFEGTSLIDTIREADGGMGGYCGVVAPVCMPERGCRFLDPSPPVWTNATAVSFSFSAFDSPPNSGRMQYRWGIGSTRLSTDVLPWVPLESSSAVQELEGAPWGLNTTVYLVAHQLQQVSLKQGGEYYVAVQGINEAGKQLGTMLSSGAIMVDWTPPNLPPGAAVFNGRRLGNEPQQSSTDSLAASWDPFVDPETGVDYYAYQVFEFMYNSEGSPGYVGPPVTEKVLLGGERSVYITDLQLQLGRSYFVRVSATNRAGLEGYRDASPVQIVQTAEGGGLSVSQAVVLVAVIVSATSACVAVITVFIVRARFRRHQMARKKQRGQMKNFKYLMTGLVKQVGDPTARDFEGLKNAKELAFVITDLENSTTISTSCPRSFDKVQEIHDNLLRELIQRHGGYEINTEGDAFHVAFTEIQSAVQFCMDVQYQLMEQDWPAEVLRLPPCKEVKGPGGALVFRGPRVRMGLHWAVEGSVVQRLHPLTKHRIFTGPAFQVTRDLCEAAHGGQVLMSHDGWVTLRQDMAGGSFPVVEQLGLYKAQGWTNPLWLYQLSQLLGKPLYRHLGPLRDLTLVEGGWGLCIMPPPLPTTAKTPLTFVAARMALEDCAAGVVSSAMGRRLYELLASVAQQFQGYIFRLSESQGCYLLVFSSAVDAVRFCHSGQALLMYSFWPEECRDYLGGVEITADNRLVFKGPRMAMAVHESEQYSCKCIPRKQASAEELAMDYGGPAEELIKLLSEVAHGGQVVLSERAWSAVQDRLPGQAQVIDLGTHILEESSPAGPMKLMEVMPSVLSKRSFPRPFTARLVEKGYRDAPDIDSTMAIVFLKVSKPAEVREAEQAQDSMSDDTMIRFITAYNVGLNRAVRRMRELLPEFEGYECKEPESGKLTVVFSSLEDAIQWSCAVQQELLSLSWPEAVLTWRECAEVACPEGGGLLWRGLRVRMGMAYGVSTFKAPLNTGRADYYGALPNLAARLMSLAQPGQVLVQGNLDSMAGVEWVGEDHSLAVLHAPPGKIELSQLGYFSIKGIEGTRLVYQALPGSLPRHFDPHPAAMRLGPVSSGLSRLLSLRVRGGPEGESMSHGLWSMRTPSRSHRPKVFTSISRSNSGTALSLRASSIRSRHSTPGSVLRMAVSAGAELSSAAAALPAAASLPSMSCLACLGGGGVGEEEVVGPSDKEEIPKDPSTDTLESREPVAPAGRESPPPGWLRSLALRIGPSSGRRHWAAEDGDSHPRAPGVGGRLERHPSAGGVAELQPLTACTAHPSMVSPRVSQCSRASSLSMPPGEEGGAAGKAWPSCATSPQGTPSGSPTRRRHPDPHRHLSFESPPPPPFHNHPLPHYGFDSLPPSSCTSPRRVASAEGGVGGTPRCSVAGAGRGSPTRLSMREIADWSYPASTLGTPASHRTALDWEASLAMEAGVTPPPYADPYPSQPPSRSSSIHSVLSPPSFTTPPGGPEGGTPRGRAGTGGGGAGATPPTTACHRPPLPPPASVAAPAAEVVEFGGLAGGPSPRGLPATVPAAVQAPTGLPASDGQGLAGQVGDSALQGAPVAVPLAAGRMCEIPIHVTAFDRGFPPGANTEQSRGSGGVALVAAGAVVNPPQEVSNRASGAPLLDAGGGGRRQGVSSRPHLQLEISESSPEASPLDIITPGFVYARQIAQLFVEGRRRSSEMQARSSWLPVPSRFRSADAAVAATQQLTGTGGGGLGRRSGMSPKKPPGLSPRKSPSLTSRLPPPAPWHDQDDDARTRG